MFRAKDEPVAVGETTPAFPFARSPVRTRGVFPSAWVGPRGSAAVRRCDPGCGGTDMPEHAHRATMKARCSCRRNSGSPRAAPQAAPQSRNRPPLHRRCGRPCGHRSTGLGPAPRRLGERGPKLARSSRAAPDGFPFSTPMTHKSSVPPRSLRKYETAPAGRPGDDIIVGGMFD